MASLGTTTTLLEEFTLIVASWAESGRDEGKLEDLY